MPQQFLKHYMESEGTGRFFQALSLLGTFTFKVWKTFPTCMPLCWKKVISINQRDENDGLICSRNDPR